MKKTFFVQTKHPIIEYRHMLIEADSLEEASSLGERIAGMKPWCCSPAIHDERGFNYSDDFLEFLNDTSTAH